MPAAARALGREVRVAVLKGRQNYVCRRLLQSFGPMLLREPREAAAFDLLLPWLDATSTGDRAEAPVEPPEGLWAELAVGGDRCLGRRCAFVSSCYSEAARARAGEADLVIANHALYFADLAAGGGVLPEHDAVVFDEAHRLEESAATWLGGRISRTALRRLAADVERACREAGEPLPARALDRVERGGERLLRAVAPPSGRRRLRDPPTAEAELLADALDALADELGGRRDLDALSRRAAAAATEARVCLEPGELERVVWAEPDAVAWAPVDVASELSARLWDDGPTAILVSATLTNGEDARFVRRRLGLDDARELIVGSPFDFAEQALLYVPRTMPDPRSDGFTERVAEEVVSLLAL